MKFSSVCAAITCGLPLLSATGQSSQRIQPTPPAASAPTLIPALVPFSGVAAAADGQPLTGEIGVKFLIYKDEHDGEPLWNESQNLVADGRGAYKAQLGAADPKGLPFSLFSNGEARWLEIQIAGGASQPRVLLASVPYALKASDSASLGGLPASAYALAGSWNGTTSAQLAGVAPDAGTTVTTTGGTTGILPVFSGTSSIISSKLYYTNGELGIGKTPSAALDVDGISLFGGQAVVEEAGTATSGTSYNSHELQFQTSAYNSSTKKAVSPFLELEAEAAGNNTSAPTAALHLLTGTGTGAPAESGFYLNSNGTIHFAPGQTFPSGSGSGTITGVTAGTGLSGGGTSGSVSLRINTASVPTLNGNNSFTGSNTFVPSIYENTDVNIDNTDRNNGNVSPGLRFGSASGEAISSQRTTNGTSETNQYGLDFWTDYTKRMSITAAGQVGIGIATPHAQLDVVSQAQYENAIAGFGSYVSGYGSDGVDGYGASTDGSSGSVGGFGGAFFGGSADNMTDAGYGLLAQGGEIGSTGSNTFSAVFRNDIQVSGNTVSDVTTSQIDHPSDPANKYLVHASVQSSEMMNMYTGNVVTDASGRATISLPAWFEAENTDFRYQLTVIGRAAQAFVKDEIASGRFTIMSNVPNVKVSWLVTAVRQDAYAKAHPLIIEQVKPARELGFYKHPELYGQSPTKQTEWARNPRMMQRIEAQRSLARSRTQHVPPPSTPLRTVASATPSILESTSKQSIER